MKFQSVVLALALAMTSVVATKEVKLRGLNGPMEGKSCAAIEDPVACDDSELGCCWKVFEKKGSKGSPKKAYRCGEIGEDDCPVRRQLGKKKTTGPKPNKSCAYYSNKDSCLAAGLDCCWKTGSNGNGCGELGEPLDEGETCDTY